MSKPFLDNWCDLCQEDITTKSIWVCRICGLAMCLSCTEKHYQQIGHLNTWPIHPETEEAVIIILHACFGDS